MARTTSTKAPVFTLGDLGVNLVSTPLHADVGELQRGQNVIFSLDRAKHGLTKRPGMAKVNADAMSGSVLAFQSVPLPQPDEAADHGAVTPDAMALFIFPDDTGAPAGTWSSTNGSTWAHANTTTDFDEGTAMQRAILLHKPGGICLGPKAKSGTDPVAFQTFDGTTWVDAFTLPNRTIGSSIFVPRDLYAWDQDDAAFYLLVWMARSSGTVDEHFQVVKVDQTTYAVSYLGCPFAHAGSITGLPTGTPTYIDFWVSGAGMVAVHNGKVFVQCQMISGTYYEGRIYMAQTNAASDEAWTLDYSTGTPSTSKAYIMAGICGHGTQLWAGWNKGAAGTAPIFCKREAEVWSVVETGVTGGYNVFQPIFALGDVVYAWKTVDPAGTTMELWYSADAWNTSAAIGTARTGYVMWTRGLRFLVNGKVYCVTALPLIHGAMFEVWQMSGATASVVHFNDTGSGDPGGCGPAFLGAAVAPPPGVTEYDLQNPNAADPTLPVAAGSVLAKATVYLSANVKVAPNVVVPIAWSAELYDVGTMWVSTAADRLTVPYGGEGYYLLTMQVAWDNASGMRDMRAYLYVNGDIVGQALSVPGTSGGNTTARYHQIRASALVTLTAGNTIQVKVLHRGPSASFSVIAGSSETYLTAARLV